MGERTENDPLDDISRRLDDAKRRRGGTPSGGPTDPKAGLNVAMRVGVELVAALIVGAAIGGGLDRWRGTAPWLMALFFVLGSAAGMMNVYRYMIGMDAAPGWGRRRDGDEEE